ncbi:hypothetical protein [uncultured Treponema sp.]|uniref:hypothetical protein n=1 Tax=Treponema sp. TaxID=166 RepID=UPI0025E2A95A|nr:hypothetical protein [uncultured Treponema sp.]
MKLHKTTVFSKFENTDFSNAKKSELQKLITRLIKITATGIKTDKEKSKICSRNLDLKSFVSFSLPAISLFFLEISSLKEESL